MAANSRVPLDTGWVMLPACHALFALLDTSLLLHVLVVLMLFVCCVQQDTFVPIQPLKHSVLLGTSVLVV